MMVSLDPPLVFVYGTLKRGGSNSALLDEIGADLYGEAETVEAYPLRIGEYPFLEDKPGEGFKVMGEIYRVPSMEGWAVLDRLEDHPRLYERRTRSFLCREAVVQAWVYFLNTEIPGLEGFPIARDFDVTKINYR